MGGAADRGVPGARGSGVVLAAEGRGQPPLQRTVRVQPQQPD